MRLRLRRRESAPTPFAYPAPLQPKPTMSAAERRFLMAAIKRAFDAEDRIPSVQALVSVEEPTVRDMAMMDAGSMVAAAQVARSIADPLARAERRKRDKALRRRSSAQ